MSKTANDIMLAVDRLLEGEELKDQPQAILLFLLSRVYLLISPVKAEHYWRQLVPLQGRIPKESQAALNEIRSVMESTSKLGAKGFAAEVIADIETAKKVAESDVEEAKRRLQDCELRLKKKRWPFGKTPALVALMETWVGIDRGYALQLTGTIPAIVCEGFVRRMNRVRPLLAEEWKLVADNVGVDKAVQISYMILEDDKPQLLLPKEIVLKVGSKIRNTMQAVEIVLRVGSKIRNAIQAVTTSQGETELLNAFGKYMKLVLLQVDGEQSDTIPALLTELWNFLTSTHKLDKIWPTRFMLLARILDTFGISKAWAEETMARLFRDSPAYLRNYVRAHWAAMTASSDNIEATYTNLMSDTGQDRNAEAWFLVTLIRRGLCQAAIDMAKKSDRSGELLPRLRRAWLCTHPGSAAQVISSTDMDGDPIGEFLLQGSVQNRVTYLKKVTDEGKRSVPGIMWAGTEEKPDGLRGFFLSVGKTIDTIIDEYTARNPLYSSYRVGTSLNEQFTQYLRIEGFGEYEYAQVDTALLETLVEWGDENATQVQSVLHAMWNAIQPDNHLLQVDWLRNAILTRCRNVFAADPEVLIHDYLDWLKKELVVKGRVWISGNTQSTLRLPVTVPLSFCVASAEGVSGLSPARRDRILLTGLDKFPGDPLTVENAACLYNSDKESLNLVPPLQLNPNLIEAWQTGIVKNAMPYIIQTILRQMGG